MLLNSANCRGVVGTSGTLTNTTKMPEFPALITCFTFGRTRRVLRAMTIPTTTVTTGQRFSPRLSKVDVVDTWVDIGLHQDVVESLRSQCEVPRQSLLLFGSRNSWHLQFAELGGPTLRRVELCEVLHRE